MIAQLLVAIWPEARNAIVFQSIIIFTSLAVFVDGESFYILVRSNEHVEPATWLCLDAGGDQVGRKEKVHGNTAYLLLLMSI